MRQATKSTVGQDQRKTEDRTTEGADTKGKSTEDRLRGDRQTVRQARKGRGMRTVLGETDMQWVRQVSHCWGAAAGQGRAGQDRVEWSVGEGHTHTHTLSSPHNHCTDGTPTQLYCRQHHPKYKSNNI